MASLHFSSEDVQAILTLVEESKNSGTMTEEDYTRYCTALESLQDTEPPYLERLPAGGHIDYNRWREEMQQHDIQRMNEFQTLIDSLQNTLATTRPRLTDAHKVKVLREILCSERIPLPDEPNPRKFVRLATPLVNTDPHELRFLFERQRERDYIIRMDRIRRNLGDLCDYRNMLSFRIRQRREN